MAVLPNGRQLAILGPDGEPYRHNGADAETVRRNPPQLWLPSHVASASIFGGASRTYWHDRFDEALRNSREDAHSFKRDARIQALLKERKRSVLHLKWHIDVPDVHDPDQKLVRDVVTAAIESIHDFQDVKSCLLEALWYGKYAVQWVWGKRWFRGVKTKVPLRWEPLHGDKIGYQWQDDGAPDIPYALVHGGSVGFLKERGGSVIPTTMGLALLLDRHWRGRFCIHHHEIEDWDFWDGQQALLKHGVGLRSQVYWTEYLRKEIEAWITDFMERVGLGVTLWKYEAGNAQALTEVQTAAKAYDRRVNVFVPCWADGSGKMIGGVERVDPPLSGCEFLRTLMEYFDRQVERLFIGQEGSSKGMSAGLGNEATAELMSSTKLQITKEDAYRISETFTGNEWNPGLVNQIVRWTEWPNPKMRELPARMLFGIESTASEKKLSGIKTLFDMNVPFRAADARDAVGIVAPVEGDEIVKNVQLEAQAKQAELQAQQMAQGGGEPGAEGAAGPGGEEPPPEGGPETPESPDEGPPELGSFLAGLRDAGQEPESENDTEEYARRGEAIQYDAGKPSHWTLDPPKNFRVSTATAKNVRWRSDKGTQRYYPQGHDPNKHGEDAPEAPETEKPFTEKTQTLPRHEQQAAEALQSLAKLNEVGPKDVDAFYRQVRDMKPGAIKSLMGKLQEAGIDLSASAGTRNRLAMHIVEAVGEKTGRLSQSDPETVKKTREKLARKGIEAPPVEGAKEATPEAVRDYFAKNFYKALSGQTVRQVHEGLRKMGVAVPDLDKLTSRDQLRDALADHMASRAALAQAFKNPAAGKIADAAMGKKSAKETAKGPRQKPSEDGPAVPLFHTTNADLPEGAPTKPDASGMVWFFDKPTEEAYGSYGDKTAQISIPQGAILDMNDMENVRAYLADGHKGRSKQKEMEWAEKYGFKAIKRGEDIAMRPETARDLHGKTLSLEAKPQAASVETADKPKLPPLKDNYLKDLNEYSPHLYREMGPDELLNGLDPAAKGHYQTLMGQTPIYLSNDKNLALGQGANKGVLVKFASKGLTGKVNTQKPGWQIPYENGSAEFIASHYDENALKNNVQEVEFPQGVSPKIRNRVQAVMGRLGLKEVSPGRFAREGSTAETAAETPKPPEAKQQTSAEKEATQRAGVANFAGGAAYESAAGHQRAVVDAIRKFGPGPVPLQTILQSLDSKRFDSRDQEAAIDDLRRAGVLGGGGAGLTIQDEAAAKELEARPELAYPTLEAQAKPETAEAEPINQPASAAQQPLAQEQPPPEKPKPSLMDRMRAKQQQIAPKPVEQAPAQEAEKSPFPEAAPKAPEGEQAAGRTPTGQEVPADLDVSGRYSVLICCGPDGKASLQFYTSNKAAKDAGAAAKKAGKTVYAGETPQESPEAEAPTFATYLDSLDGVFNEMGIKPDDVTTEFIGKDDPIAERAQWMQAAETAHAERRTVREAKGKAVTPKADRPADPVQAKQWDALVAQAESESPAVEAEMRANAIPSAQAYASWVQAGKPKRGAAKEPLRFTPEDVPLEKQDVQPKKEVAAEKAIKAQQTAKRKADAARLLSAKHAKLAEIARKDGDADSAESYESQAKAAAEQADALEQGATHAVSEGQQQGRDLSEHQAGDGGRQEAIAGSSDLAPGSGQEQQAAGSGPQGGAEAGQEVAAEPALTKRQEGGRNAAETRQARQAEREQSRANFEEQAAAHGADPASAHQVADELRQLDSHRVEKETNLLRQAQKQLAHYGVDPKKLRRQINRDKVEEAEQVKSLDVISESLAALPEFAEFFRDAHDTPGAAAERLFEFLQETACKGCDPKPKSEEEIYNDALARIEATGGRWEEPEEETGAESDGGDTGFDFGANAPEYMPSAARETEEGEQPTSEEPAAKKNLFGEVEQPKKQGLFNEPVAPDKKPRAVDKDKSLTTLSAVQKRDLQSWDMPQPLKDDPNNFRMTHLPTGNRIESDPFGQYVVKDKDGKKIGKPFETADEAAQVAEQGSAGREATPSSKNPYAGHAMRTIRQLFPAGTKNYNSQAGWGEIPQIRVEDLRDKLGMPYHQFNETLKDLRQEGKINLVAAVDRTKYDPDKLVPGLGDEAFGIVEPGPSYEEAKAAKVAEQAAETPNAAALTTAINTLPRVPDRDQDSVNHGLPVDEHPPYRGTPNNADLAAAPVVDVPLKDLIATQASVSRQHMTRKAKGGEDKPVMLVRAAGKLYIQDGTHQATLDKLRGRQTVKAQVFDYDPQQKRPVLKAERARVGLPPLGTEQPTTAKQQETAPAVEPPAAPVAAEPTPSVSPEEKQGRGQASLEHIAGLRGGFRSEMTKLFGAQNVDEDAPGQFRFRMGDRWGELTLNRGRADGPFISMNFFWNPGMGKGGSTADADLQKGSLAMGRSIKNIARWAATNGVGMKFSAEPRREKYYGTILKKMGFVPSADRASKFLPPRDADQYLRAADRETLQYLRLADRAEREGDLDSARLYRKQAEG